MRHFVPRKRGNFAKFSRPKLILALLLTIAPQRVKHRIYTTVFGWSIHPTAYVGYSFILVDKLILGSDSSISHGNVIKGCEKVQLDIGARIGGLNWISAPPIAWARTHTKLSSSRKPELILGRDACILHRHLIDCSDSVVLEPRAALAGYRSQVLTHSFDVRLGFGTTAPVIIGENSFVFTSALLLPGSRIPKNSVVAAGAVVANGLPSEFKVYGGVPATCIKDLPPDSRYFSS